MCFIDIVLWFVARSPRGRLNVTQFLSVLFFALLAHRLLRIQTKAHEGAGRPAGMLVVPGLAVALGIIVWSRMLPYYFISDDFGLLDVSRMPIPDFMWRVFRYGDGIGTFFRPVTFSSFAWDYAIWDLSPVGYHLTNLFLHGCSIAGLFVMLRQFGVTQHIAAMTVAIFAAMPIQVESVAWMSGRFDVLVTTLSVWTVAAYVWSRSTNRIVGYVIAILLSVVAMCSKETGFVLPLIIVATDIVVFRSFAIWKLSGFLLVGSLVFVFRMVALGGIGGYQDISSPMSVGWKTLEALLIRGPAQILFGLNWTQPAGILVITATATLAALLLLLIRQTTLGKEQRRMILLALFWTFVTMIPAHFLLLIGPGLSNSRVLCLPSVGIAIVLGQLLGSARSQRFQTFAFIAIATILNIGVLHNLAAWRWTSQLGDSTLKQIVEMEPTPPTNAQFVFSNLPDTVRGVFFFSAGLNSSLKLVYGRDDITAIHDSQLPANEETSHVPRINLVWKGELEELVVRQSSD
jgi:hypothetical protein